MPTELTPEQKRFESSLSQEESKTAIYIDFEGFMSKPSTASLPLLIGKPPSLPIRTTQKGDKRY
jgi:hypothetical protein